MKQLEKVKGQFREMVAYCMDTKDSEIIDNYTETFLEIYKQHSLKLEKERDAALESRDAFKRVLISRKQELQTLKDHINKGIEKDFIINCKYPKSYGDYIMTLIKLTSSKLKTYTN